MRRFTKHPPRWLPSRRMLAEATVASFGLTVRHASGCCRAVGLVSSPSEISQEGQKVRRFDRSPRHSARNAAPDRRRQRDPQISPSALAFCPSELPVRNLERPRWQPSPSLLRPRIYWLRARSPCSLWARVVLMKRTHTPAACAASPRASHSDEALPPRSWQSVDVTTAARTGHLIFRSYTLGSGSRQPVRAWKHERVLRVVLRRCVRKNPDRRRPMRGHAGS
jgi:hypothetical protein